MNKFVVDLGPIIGIYLGRSIFEWLLFCDNRKFEFDRTEPDVTKTKADEVYLPPGLIYTLSITASDVPA